MSKRKASIDSNFCVACGACMKECPFDAIHIEGGMYAVVNQDKCVGCGKCQKVCPASVIDILKTEGK